MKTTVSEKGQVTIPGKLRRRLGIGRGTVLAVTEEKGRLILEKVVAADPVTRAYGLLSPQATPTDVDSLISEMRDGEMRDGEDS